MYLLTKRMIVTDDFCNTREITRVLGIYLTEEQANAALDATETRINATFVPCFQGVGIISRTNIRLEVKPLFHGKNTREKRRE